MNITHNLSTGTHNNIRVYYLAGNGRGCISYYFMQFREIYLKKRLGKCNISQTVYKAIRNGFIQPLSILGSVQKSINIFE